MAQEPHTPDSTQPVTAHAQRRGIASWSIRRPVGTLMLTSVILVLGGMFIQRLPLDLLPRIVYPQVRVSVSNQGVEPGVLEETVAKCLPVSKAALVQLTRNMALDLAPDKIRVNSVSPGWTWSKVMDELSGGDRE